MQRELQSTSLRHDVNSPPLEKRRRGTLCRNHSLLFTFISFSQLKNVSPFSDIRRFAIRYIRISVRSQNSFDARQSLPAESRTMFISWPASAEPLHKRSGSRN